MVNNKVVIVNGASGSGKSLFEETVKRMWDNMYLGNADLHLETRIVSSVQHIKYGLNNMGLDATHPDDETRKILAAIAEKQGPVRFYPFLTSIMEERLRCYSEKGCVIWFVDVREPVWIIWLKNVCDWLDFETYTVWVARESAELKAMKHPATQSDDFHAIYDYTYDIVIDNDTEGEFKDVINNLENESIRFLNFIGVPVDLEWLAKHRSEVL